MSIRKRRTAAAPLEPVAGNGLLDRRALLGRGIVFAGAMTTGSLAHRRRRRAAQGRPVEPGDGRGPAAAAGAVALREARGAHAHQSQSASCATRTRARRIICCKARSRPTACIFTICHSGLPDIDPAKHKLVIHGLVKQPMVYTLESLSRYPMVSRMAFVECGGNSAPMFSNEPVQATAQALHGLVSNAEWTGVLLSTLLEETGIDPKAKWLLAEGADSLPLHRSVPVKKALGRRHDRALPERRAHHARQRLSDAPAAARLPGQHERQVPAPDQAHRSAGHELLRGQDLLADPAGRQDPGGSTSCRRSNRSSPIPRSATR